MMLPAGFRIEPFDIKNAGENEYAALSRFSNKRRAERLPDEPPTPLEEHTADWQNIPDHVKIWLWLVFPEDGDEIIAQGDFVFADLPENRHVAHFSIAVLPEYRRRGLAKVLLARIAETAKQAERTLLMAGTNDRIPAGEAFLTRLGASKGLEGHTNQLDIAADLDRALLKEWQEKAKERASDFELVWFDGDYPQDLIEEIVQVSNAIHNTMPRGELELEDSQHTVEHFRHWEKSMKASGTERLSVYVRHTPTGKLVGFTDVFYNPNRSYLLNQGGTGVLPEYRGLGLGRWLKAAMLERALEEKPDLRFVRTGNADRNAPMLSINRALGFKPFIADAAWQIPTEKVFDYLAEKKIATDDTLGRKDSWHERP